MIGPQTRRRGILRKSLFLILLLALTAACIRTGSAGSLPSPGTQPTAGSRIITPSFDSPVKLNTMAPLNLPQHPGGSLEATATPDPPRVLPTLRSQTEYHVVQAGETLGIIARQYGVLWTDIAQANPMDDPNILSIGQTLVIPPPVPAGTAPSNKMIPDSELVYGPASTLLNLQDFVDSQNGFLRDYTEEVDGKSLTGWQILARISREYSVNPRLLLSALEYKSGWVTQKKPPVETLEAPMGIEDAYHKGLYQQLAWAADRLNQGYYLWKGNAISHWSLADGTVLLADPTINAGTAAIQYLLSLQLEREEWERAVSNQGFILTYQKFFGSPFDFAIEPPLPVDLTQPVLELPFKKGETWSFTGGPHGGWGDGSAWAGLDFAPPGEGAGCVASDSWVTAVTDGLVIHAENGVVILDLDGDGFEQTGWTILYLHIETRDRVKTGQWLKTDDPIGHPSCEGGVSNGTHVHLARRYNGEWIPADGNIPFNLSGWVSQGSGQLYDGILVRNGQTVEAWDSRKSENQITR